MVFPSLPADNALIVVSTRGVVQATGLVAFVLTTAVAVWFFATESRG